MKVTKSCRYLDFERGNAALHIFGFLVHQKKNILDCITEGGNAASFILQRLLLFPAFQDTCHYSDCLFSKLFGISKLL